MRLFARLVIAGLIAGFAIGGYAAYRIWDQGNRDERTPADAIVVMGAAQYDGRPSPVFAARLDHAIALYHDGVAPRLIVTGGKREGDRTTEAASARSYAIEHGVPENAILSEDASRTTLQSIRRVAALMRRKIGIIFQDFKLLPTKTVWENVAFALEVTGHPRRQIRPAVDRVLAIVGLTAQAKQIPAQLSGGEQQRTAIARALVHDPRLIIADEPTGNLDPLISWEILQLLLRINELGVTVLMATHNAEVVTALRKRVVALEEGRIIRDEVGGAYHRED